MSSKFADFKELYGLKQCIKCGADTTDVNHHLYCDRCWRRNTLDKITKSLDKESFEAIQKRKAHTP